MKIFISILFLILQGCSPTPEFTALKSEINAGRDEAAACQSYSNEIKKYDFSPSLNLDTPHANKKEALTALALLEKRPRSQPHTKRANELFISSLNELHYRELIEALESIAPSCEPFFPLQQLGRLMSDEKAFSLTAEEKRRIQAASKSFLMEWTGPVQFGLVGYAVATTTLREFAKHYLAEKDRAEVAQQATDFLNQFEEKRKTLTDHIRGRRGFISKYMRPLSADLREELEICKQLSQDYNALAARAMK